MGRRFSKGIQFFVDFKQRNRNTNLKRTRLSSLLPSGKGDKVKYTPGSSCMTVTDFSVGPLVP